MDEEGLTLLLQASSDFRAKGRNKEAFCCSALGVLKCRPNSLFHAKALIECGLALQDVRPINNALLLCHGVEHAIGLASRGYIERKAGNYEAAIASFCEAKPALMVREELRDVYIGMLCKLCNCYLHLKRMDDLWPACSELVCVTLPNNSVHAYAIHAQALCMAVCRQYGKAEDFCKKALVCFEALAVPKGVSEASQTLEMCRQKRAPSICATMGWRMCDGCEAIRLEMPECLCGRAWYCNDGCAASDWHRHQKTCNLYYH